jgi:hypothetical protein
LSNAKISNILALLEHNLKMKKIYLTLVGLFAVLVSSAQVEFGVQFSPTLSTTRTESKTVSTQFDNYKSGVRFNAGLVLDIFFRDNLAVTTGAWYGVKRSGIATDVVGNTNIIANTQYVNIPIGLKFYTQEWIPKTRFFLSVTGVSDLKVSKDKIKIEKKDITNPPTFSKFFDASVMVGLGMDLKVGSHNKVFGQLYYNRGLINRLTNDYNASINSKTLNVKNDLYGLMLGYKF